MKFKIRMREDRCHVSEPHSQLQDLGLHVAAPLVFGGLMYLLWRSPSLLMFSWIEHLGITPYIQALRAGTATLILSIPKWIVMSLPGGLWNYSLVSFTGWVWRDEACPERLVWLLTASALGPLSEVGQAMGLVPGTFDSIDLIIYVMGGLLALSKVSFCSGCRVEKAMLNLLRNRCRAVLGHGNQ